MSSLDYTFAFGVAFLTTLALTAVVIRLAKILKIYDYPDSPRKIQARPIPKLGGLAVYSGFLLTVLAWIIFFPDAFGLFIKFNSLFGIFVGGLILAVGGYLDDKFALPPGNQIVFTVLAVLAVMVSGIQLSYINNPFGGAILLDSLKVLGYPVFGGLFVFFWILGMIYTTKFLDGMDGLVSGIAGIGAVVLFFLSLVPEVNQPDTALLSLMFGGAILGFLPWNFFPAKIFLGESGSTFAGFMIGVLAVISGGKVATALLIMGIPILDTAWVILRRIFYKYSPFEGDRKHLHFRLLDLGLSHRNTVLVLYFISAGFGVSGLFLQSVAKLVALAILFGVMILLGAFLVISYRKKNPDVESKN